jgi:hypothetical protein
MMLLLLVAPAAALGVQPAAVCAESVMMQRLRTAQLVGRQSSEALLAVDDLWGGLDSARPVAYQNLLQSAADVSPGLGHGARGNQSATADDLSGEDVGEACTSLQIVGMFDSGTNLLRMLLAANLVWERPARCVDDGPEHTKGFFWKHTAPRQLERELDALKRKGQRVVLVAMVRSPLFHVVSLAKAPYALGSCVQDATATPESDSRTICSIPNFDPQIVARNPSEMENFSGVTGVWNSYVEEYDRLQDAGGDAYHRTIVVEYERLVLDPEPVVREVAAALGQSVRSAFKTIEAPAKAHGNPHGREKALQDLQQAAWLQKEPVSRQDIRSSLCGRLNISTMRRHSYPTKPQPSSYMDDCA